MNLILDIINAFWSIENSSYQILIVNAMIGNMSWFVWSKKYRPTIQSILMGCFFGPVILLEGLLYRWKQKLKLSQ